jgi:tetratricopeptide (TPR) repeat protein
MAKKEQQNVLQKNSSEVPSDPELFTGEVRKELSEREMFVGDEDFYTLLADSASDATVQQPAHKGQPAQKVIPYKRFSILQKVLVAGIIAIEAMLLYVLLKPLIRPINKIPTPTAHRELSSKLPVGDSTPGVQEQIQKTEPLSPLTEPLSLKVAHNFYLQKDYDKAYVAYNQLHQSLPAGIKEELLGDFLQLKMAMCLKMAGNSDEANRLLRTLSQSQSPVVRVLANYNLSLLEMSNKQYLKARTRAYQAIAIISAVDFDKDWALSLQSDCHFVVAESMTKNVLSLCHADKDLPAQLWNGAHLRDAENGSLSNLVEADPFNDLDETQLWSFLNSGSKQLKEGLLGPQIKKLEYEGAPPRWSIIASGASIEELLARFAANAGFDVSWVYEETQGSVETRGAIRKRIVSLYLSAETTQEAIDVAAGHVGLLALLDENGLVKICNPVDYSSLSERVNLLTQDTISLWRRFLITFHDDQRIPNAHFALGLLHAQKDGITNAIAEYKLIANHFSQTSLAPYALLNSSKLKANLHDYSGAREDLTQLVEQYPDTEFYGQACLNLADVTKKAGVLNEAERLYRKVYNLGLSLELQRVSALGTGRCTYEARDYETAAKWLTRYLELARDRSETDLYLAYFLLGKTNLELGKFQQACTAFQFALDGPTGSLTREKYVETVSALVETQIQLENFVGALELLESVHPWQFSKKESIEILLLKSRILRFIGLPDKAISEFGDITEYLPDSQLKTRVSFEVVNCYIAKGDLEFAHNRLTEILISAAPGPLTHEIALKLAEVCLKLDQTSQTVSVCLQLLDTDPSEEVKQKTLKVLASAYNRQKKFDNAALALLGQW